MLQTIQVVTGAFLFSGGFAVMFALFGKQPRPLQSWTGLGMVAVGAALLNLK